MDDEMLEKIDASNSEYMSIPDEWCVSGGFLFSDAIVERIEDAKAAK